MNRAIIDVKSTYSLDTSFNPFNTDSFLEPFEEKYTIWKNQVADQIRDICESRNKLPNIVIPDIPGETQMKDSTVLILGGILAGAIFIMGGRR